MSRPTRSSYAVGTPLTRSLRMTVNFWTSSWDSLEMEKARLFTAARLRSSRTLLMSSSSLEASAGVTTASFGESFLSCEVDVRFYSKQGEMTGEHAFLVPILLKKANRFDFFVSLGFSFSFPLPLSVCFSSTGPPLCATICESFPVESPASGPTP